MNKSECIEKIIHIADRMLETRPRDEVKMRPYIRAEFVSKTLRRGIHIDLSKYYPDAQNGDYAYVCVNLKCQHTSKVALTVKGAVSFTVNGENYDVNGKYSFKTSGRLY